MNDKILLGGLQKKLLGSLAYRVFYVLFFLLFLPLLIHSIISDKIDYNEKISNLYRSMSLIAQDESLSFGQRITEQWNMLDVAAKRLSSDKASLFGFEDLKEMKESSDALDVFFFQEEEGKLVCTKASSSSMVGKDFSMIGPVNELIKKEKNLIVPNSEGVFYLVESVIAKGSSKPTGFIAASFAFKDYFFDLKGKKDFPYALELSVLSDKGIVMEATGSKLRKSYLGKEVTLVPVSYFDGGYLLENGKDKHLAVKAPLSGSSYEILLDVLQKDILAVHQRQMYLHIAIFLFSSLIVGGTLAFISVRILGKPTRKLIETMEKVAEGRVSEKYQPQKMGFEINWLGNYFNIVVEKMLQNAKEAEEHHLQRNLLAQEMKLGHSVQQELMPKEMHLKTAVFETAALYLPAKEVGGDFYDVFPLDQDRTLLVVADTSDKGIFACLYSLSIRSMIRAYASSYIDLPTIMEKINNLFCQDTKESSVFVTAWVAVFNRKTKKLTYSSAGHYPTLLKRNNELLELSGSNTAFGVLEDQKFPGNEILLQKSDMLLLYSDGVLETVGPNKEFFGKERMKKVFLSTAKERPQEIVAEMAGELKGFSFGQVQFDDTTILMVRYIGG